MSASINDASQLLQLNHVKTTSQHRQHLLPTRTIRVCDLEVSSTRSVRDLGVYIDADLSIHTHVTTVSFVACDILCQDTPCYHWSTQLSLARLTTVTRFWLLSGNLMRRLQSVLNAAARLVFSARRSDHITPLLCELHWLKVPERIQFQLSVLAYRFLHNTVPAYLTESLQLVRDVDARGHLHPADSMTLVVPNCLPVCVTNYFIIDLYGMHQFFNLFSVGLFTICVVSCVHIIMLFLCQPSENQL